MPSVRQTDEFPAPTVSVLANAQQPEPRHAREEPPQTPAFFEGLGFGFNPQFTDDTAACMVLSDDGYFMLLTEPKFREFSKKQICDTRTHNEGLFPSP